MYQETGERGDSRMMPAGTGASDLCFWQRVLSSRDEYGVSVKGDKQRIRMQLQPAD